MTGGRLLFVENGPSFAFAAKWENTITLDECKTGVFDQGRDGGRLAVGLCFLLMLLSPTQLLGDSLPVAIGVDAPRAILRQLPFSVSLTHPDLEGGPVAYRLTDAAGRELAAGIVVPGEKIELENLRVGSVAALPLTLYTGPPASDLGEVRTFRPLMLPGWTSLLPPLLAIVLAFVLREVVLSLFCGIYLGALLLFGFQPLIALWRSIDYFIAPALGDPNHAAVVIFALLLGGMIGVISRSGGMAGVLEAVRSIATTPRRAKAATYVGGLSIFFNDYANALIVGNTMRPLTDKLGVPREKLAYIVDSTAAPVAGIVFVSTWAGFMISLIDNSLNSVVENPATDPVLAADLAAANPFVVYMHSVPYMFYPFLSLVMVALVIWTGRDFGPMLHAERRAARGGGLSRPGAMLLANTTGEALEADENAPRRWFNAVVPIMTVILVVLGGLYFGGRAVTAADASIWDILGAANPFHALLWGSLSGCLVAIGLTVGQRILTPHQALDAWCGGLRALMLAIVILVLAWSIGAVTGQLGTAEYIAESLTGRMPPVLLPSLVFVTAMLISFATGTSWGTMAILVPLVVPLAVAIGGGEGFEGGTRYTILLGSISSVLAGAIFGDHCSPISDTTVMSSMSSACDHMDHVRTQAPYAILVAGTGIVVGDLGTALLGIPLWGSYLAGATILLLVLHLAGRRSV